MQFGVQFLEVWRYGGDKSFNSGVSRTDFKAAFVHQHREYFLWVSNLDLFNDLATQCLYGFNCNAKNTVVRIYTD